MSNTKACFGFMVRTSLIMLLAFYTSLGYSAEKVELDRVESHKKKQEQKAMVVLKPHEIINGTTSNGEKPALGTLIGTCGVIKAGSIVFSKDSLLVKFIIGESASEINVEFIGILPDYFSEQVKV
jgi:cytochrome c-type biogenesis protein CcmE